METRTLRQALLAEFGEELAQLRIACGSPSYAQLRRTMASLAPTTVSDVLNGRSAPKLDFVTAFVSACAAHAALLGIDLEAGRLDVPSWHSRWHELATALLRAKSGRATAPTVPLADVLEKIGRLSPADRERAEQEVRRTIRRLSAEQ